MHDFVVCKCWNMDELVVFKIHFVEKFEHILLMFAIHLFPFLSQSSRQHFGEIWTCASRDTTNCNTISVVLLINDVDDYSKPWVLHGRYSNYIVPVHEFSAILLVLVLCNGCCCILTHCLRVDVGRASSFDNMQKCGQGMGSVVIADNLRYGENASLWNMESLSVNTSFIKRFVPIFISHVLGTIGRSNAYSFLLPLTQCLMLLGQNQNSCYTLLVKQDVFFLPLYVGVGIPYLLVLTLALHGVFVLAYMTQHLLAELGAILQCAIVKKGNQSLAPMWCGHTMICKIQ